MIASAFIIGCSGRGEPVSGGLVDDFGDSISVDIKAERIVSLNPVTTELLFAIGAGNLIVGRTEWDLYPDSARLIYSVGDGIQPNVEAILGLNPDLVILYATETNRGAVRQLRAAGVRTLTYRTDRFSDLERVAAVLGSIVSEEERGRTVVDTVNATLKRVESLSRVEPAPTVFWHIWDAPLLTVGATSFLNELLNVAGARNVFDDIDQPSPQVALEEIVKRDPDYVIAGPRNSAKILAHPAWQAVRAVREGRVLVPDTIVVGRPGVRLGEAAVNLRALIIGDSISPVVP